jgi:hypothetical protein
MARKKLSQSSGAVDESILQGMDKGTLAYALGLAGIARHNARLQGGDAAKAAEGWEPEWHRPFGYLGAARGLHDRGQ